MPTPPPLKRQKHEKETCTECQRLPSGGPCARHQSIHEYQTLRSALEDPVVSLSTIERQLRKLEVKLRVEPAPRAPSSPPSPARPPSSNLPPTTPTPTAHGSTELADPVMSLQADGIHIHTSITEPHHFLKLLVRGINPTHVHDQAKRVFTRPLDLVFPDTPIPQPPVLPPQPPTTQTIDDFANDPAELAWVDRVLATRYPRCFLMYQQTEADRLVQWISPAYIQGLHNQPKVEHSLLSKAVRAFVYRHEATHHHQSDHHHHHHHHHHHQQQQPLDEIDHEENQPFERKRKERISTFFFQQAEELLELCYTTSSRNTIRALLHMNMCQWLTPGGEQKAAQYCDLALRMAQDLQLQRDGGVLVNEQLREDDRRLWWSVVWAHLWTATSFDRPLLIDPDIITNARPPAKRVSEATEVGLCVDFGVHSVRLLVVIHKIRQTLAKKTTELHLLDQLQEMERLLLAWRQQLPDALQPEHYWQLAASNATSNASSTSTMWMAAMDDYGGDVRARALAVELSILLLGQWARVKLQLYECFATDDRSILDLLMLRNRLDIANEFTSYLVHIVQRARPCMLMYLLTAIHPCLHTFLELATYNDDDIRDQALRQLATLKNLFHQYPFFNEPISHHWVMRIDAAIHASFASAPSQPARSHSDASMQARDASNSSRHASITTYDAPMSHSTPAPIQNASIPLRDASTTAHTYAPPPQTAPMPIQRPDIYQHAPLPPSFLPSYPAPFVPERLAPPPMPSMSSLPPTEYSHAQQWQHQANPSPFQQHHHHHQQQHQSFHSMQGGAAQPPASSSSSSSSSYPQFHDTN